MMLRTGWYNECSSATMKSARIWSIICSFALFAAGCGKPSLLRQKAPAEDALFFSGGWKAGEGFLTRSDLMGMNTFKTIESQIVPGAGVAKLGVISLKELIKVLGLQADADGIVLECTDRWESFMELSYIHEHDPQLLVLYDGNDPSAGNWPMFGGDIEPLAPFYVFIEGDMSGFADAPKYGMISATQMSGIRAVNTTERYAPYFDTPMDALSLRAQEGRTLFLQRCSTCHQGPGGVGGNVSERPFVILQTYAAHNADYFKKIVANPKTVYPETIMPRHDDFTEEHYARLLAFLQETATLARNAQP